MIRKAFYGDKVSLNIFSYSTKKHYGHEGYVKGIARVRKTKNKSTYLLYEIDCECGQVLKSIKPRDLILVQSRALESEGFDLFTERMRYFLKQISYGKDTTNKQTLLLQVNAALKPLKPKYKKVIRYRFSLNKDCLHQLSYKEIGEKLGVSKQRVEIIYKLALKELIGG